MLEILATITIRCDGPADRVPCRQLATVPYIYQTRMVYHATRMAAELAKASGWKCWGKRWRCPTCAKGN